MEENYNQAAPVAEAPTVSNPASPPTPQPASPVPAFTETSPKKKNKLLPVVGLVAALLIGGGVAAYASVFNKSPEDKFYSALSNTASALEGIKNIDTKSPSKNIEGSIDLSSPLALDGSLSGSFDPDGNANIIADVGAAGSRVNAELRTVAVDNSEAPDLYFTVSGLDGIAGLIGGFGGADASPVVDALSDLNGNWYVIDHTLLEQALSSGGTEAEDGWDLSEEQINEITERAFVPVRERLLGSADDKAVFVVNEELGDEEFEGDGTTKVNVGINKDNLISFVSEYESIIKETALKELYEMSGDSVDGIDFGELRDHLQAMDFEDASADVWLSGDRFIRNIRFYPLEDKKDTNFIDFSLDYEGGDEFPLMMSVTMDDEGVKGDASLGFTFNRSNGDISLSFTIDVDETDGTRVAGEATLAISSSDDAVEVEKPNARSFLELIGAFGALYRGNGSLDPSLQSELEQFQLDDTELSL